MEIKDFKVGRTVYVEITGNPIEKVVEQLENLEPFHVDGYGDDFVNRDDAIEIVKQGGIGTDDVCEWEYDKHFEFAKSKCGSIDTKRIEFKKLKYCPYCGKKIKVVE